MFEQLSFYFRHSLNDLRVNAQRTFFAILCIAAGVAAIVSLQTVAVMIGDTLTDNLQVTNQGDIKIELGIALNDEQEAAFAQAAEDGVLDEVPQVGPFTRAGVTSYTIGGGGLERFQQWIDENYPGQVEMTYRLETTDPAGIFLGSGIGTSVSDPTTGTAVTSVSPVLIDPAVYPFYSTIQSVDDKSLSELLQSPTDIVVDEKVATGLDLQVGDTVRINGADTDFTVSGIVPTDVEVTDPFSAFLSAQFGFYYLSHDALQHFSEVTPRAQKVNLRLTDPSQVGAVNAAFVREFPYLDTTTTDDLREQNAQIAEQTNQLVTIMGLVSLLLGSIGIVNTMQVIVRRRTIEVAVLKTIGLQADQVSILFLVEAFIMGIIGSIVGIILGWVTTFVIKGVAESLVAQELGFRIAVGPALNGFIVGVLVTTIFGFLPTLAAGQVRPGVVLRPSENMVPRAGWLRTLLALVVIILALSFVAQSVLGSFQLAIQVTIGAFIAAGFLLALLSLLIWLVGRFLPTFGFVDLKISLRQMLAARGRAAITLLALVVGVFSLSLITLFADSINNLLSYALEEGSGGNVIVSVAAEPMLGDVEGVISSIEGVSSSRTVRSYAAHFVGLEEADGTILNGVQLAQRVNDNFDRSQLEAFGGEEFQDFDIGQNFVETLSAIDARNLNQLPEQSFIAGRGLTPEDAGSPVIVISELQQLDEAQIEVGDKLVYQFGEGPDAPTVAYEIVGIAEAGLMGPGIGGGPVYTSVESLPENIPPTGIQVLVDVAEEQIPELRRQLGAVPGTFVLETAVFTKLLSALLGTFTAFPTMVALLGLIVGGVVIANSVALSTMERRREIAVMKAVGLQRERVLAMILLENGVLGLIGGLLGVGIGLIALIVLLGVSGAPSQAIPYGTALVLMLLCVFVALIAATTTAWGASGEKPLNVLRYE